MCTVRPQEAVPSRCAPHGCYAYQMQPAPATPEPVACTLYLTEEEQRLLRTALIGHVLRLDRDQTADRKTAEQIRARLEAGTTPAPEHRHDWRPLFPKDASRPYFRCEGCGVIGQQRQGRTPRSSRIFPVGDALAKKIQAEARAAVR